MFNRSNVVTRTPKKQKYCKNLNERILEKIICPFKTICGLRPCRIQAKPSFCKT